MMTYSSRIRRWLSSKWGHWLPPIAWMGVIFLLSSRPDLPNLTPGLPDLQNVLAHMTEYGILAYLLARALDHGRYVNRTHLWTIGVVMLYAASDEWHQKFVPGRHADPVDWVVDVTGALLVLGLRHWWIRRQRTTNRRPAPAESGYPQTTEVARRRSSDA